MPSTPASYVWYVEQRRILDAALPPPTGMQFSSFERTKALRALNDEYARRRDQEGATT